MKSFFLIGFLIILAHSASLHMENAARNDNAQNNNMKNENEKMDGKIWGDEEDRQDNKAFEKRRRMQTKWDGPNEPSCEERCALACLPVFYIVLAYASCWGACYEKSCKATNPPKPPNPSKPPIVMLESDKEAKELCGSAEGKRYVNFLNVFVIRCHGVCSCHKSISGAYGCKPYCPQILRPQGKSNCKLVKKEHECCKQWECNENLSAATKLVKKSKILTRK